jgi:hypothetical protein
MILVLLIAALAVAGLVLRLRTEGDLRDRDTRDWWPGARS